MPRFYYSDQLRELFAYLHSKEQIGIIDVLRTKADSVAHARNMLEMDLIGQKTCLSMMSGNPGIILYGVGQKIWRKVLLPEIKKILPRCKANAKKQLKGYVDVYINLNP